MKRNYLFSLTGILLLFLTILVGCNSDTETSSEESSKNSNDKVIKIGATIPLSGPGAPYGSKQINGMEMAVEQINQNGELNDYTVELITMDSKAEAELSLNAFNKLIDVDDVVWTATAYTEPPLAQQPIADKEKVVLMNSGGLGDELGEISGGFFYNSLPLLSFESDILLDYLIESTDIERLAIIYTNDESAMVKIQEKVKGKWESSGKEVVSVVSNGKDQTDVKSQLLKVKSENPDALIMINDGTTTQQVIQQTEEVGLDTQLVGFATHLIPNNLELSASEGMIATSYPYDPDPEFVDAYKEKFNEEPDWYSVSYYDQILIFRDAALWALENEGNINGETLKKALDEIEEFEGANGKTSFDDTGNTMKDFDIVKIQDNKPEVITTIEINK